MCLCDEGWDHDPATPPRCTVDVDECSQVDKPCHDGVQCINVPGTYFCGACGAGKLHFTDTSSLRPRNVANMPS